jgi:hypothetical protein
MPIPNVPNELALGGGAGLHGDDIQVLTRFLEELRQTVSALEAATASIPVGGEVGQFLAKKSLTDFDLDWATAPYADYIFNSSGAASGNRFNDWGDLVAALALIEGPRSITFEQNEVIPAGSYDLSNTTLRGNFSQAGIAVEFADGATISNWTNGVVAGGLLISNAGSTPVFTVGPTEFIVLLLDSAAVMSSSAAPFVLVEAGANGFVLGSNGGGSFYNATAGPFGGQPVLDIEDGSGFVGFALAGAGAGFEDDTISGDAATLLRLVQDPAVDLTLGLTQPNFSGVIFDLYFTNAQAVGYDPSGTSGVLSATTVQGAIDELAGLV